MDPARSPEPVVEQTKIQIVEAASRAGKCLLCQLQFELKIIWRAGNSLLVRALVCSETHYEWEFRVPPMSLRFGHR